MIAQAKSLYCIASWPTLSLVAPTCACRHLPEVRKCLAGVDPSTSLNDFVKTLQERSGIVSGRLELLSGFPPTVLQVLLQSCGI